MVQAKARSSASYIKEEECFVYFFILGGWRERERERERIR
jgi:hypothetical protein